MPNGQSKLEIIALVISILVIVCMAISFAFLFFLYSKYKSSHISFGHEDEEVEQEVNKDYRKIVHKKTQLKLKPEEAFQFRLFESNFDPPKEGEAPDMTPVSVTDSLAKAKEEGKKWKIISRIAYGSIYAVLAAFFIFVLACQGCDKGVFIGNTALYTVQTGSMESANSKNEYLIENNLNNRLEQYSLVGIDKVYHPEDIELYDILAYTHENTTYLHRVIEIKEKEGSRLFTLRGDANSASLTFETDLDFDAILGRYNGFQSYGLGVATMYLRSSIGAIAVITALTFLLFTGFSEYRIEKAINERMVEISKRIDKELEDKPRREVER